MSDSILVPREMLEDYQDLVQAEIDDHVFKLGEGYRPYRLKHMREKLSKIQALLSPVGCQHEWLDARNSVITSGEICAKMCGAIRPGNAASGDSQS